ncbi:MAG: DUF502 domain-containing protein [Bacteroidetes bacterium]|jgi:uncharacterized membrane protein|nr:DUF502 domain-containing protein [Bacteroidota bacterium]HQW45712.1 DUF502 domain-containing protein [Chitinophagaceae bacterium]MBK7038889.1 DUF502 domain-containing protein [Bacteroidota bacterium]MBK7589016.1 DUF502 domain-containing protein [Bacteroidota bacterium]MBK8329534.1 DUF502 domain-containing protein [Bacteroidota bacterium]
MRKLATLLLKYFFQGIIIVSPLAITAWAAYSVFDFIDSSTRIPSLPRGVGFVIVISSLILIGWLGSTFLLWKLLINFFDNILERTPFLKFIYGSVKDVVESFMGEKKKFNKPVLVKIRINPEVYQIGFITQKNLSKLGFENKVAVYMPHSYAVSGMLVIVDKENVTPLDINPSDAMKMAVSGGVTGYDEEQATDIEIHENR